jgi:hypothetical protein
MRSFVPTVLIPATLLSTSAFAQARFGPPEQVTAGGAAISEYLYPTPVLFDVDGDAARELVIGDLFGHLRVCERGANGNDVEWGAAEHMQADGKPLKLNNW